MSFWGRVKRCKMFIQNISNPNELESYFSFSNKAFKSHKLHDPLIDPGTADLTADVDFSYLHNFGNDSGN